MMRTKSGSWLPRPWLALAVFLLIWPYAVSYSDVGAVFTLVNKTPYFLHAVINNEAIAYIPPGVSISRETSSAYEVTAQVTYSPGQGKTATVLRTFQATVHTVSTTSSSQSQSNDCSNSNNSTCNSTSTSSVDSYTTVDPIAWVVTPDTLASH
jgi:hypothetical protein